MRVQLLAADNFGCGMYRMIWPGEALARQGHAVEVIPPEKRDVRLVMDGERVHDVVLDDPPDVMVFQRLTHPWMTQAIPLLRAKGVAVVIDVDDDLSRIHPRNPAFEAMHPRNARDYDPRSRTRPHSWENLKTACRAATLVTVSTPALLTAYAAHGRGRVLYNMLPDAFDAVERQDSATIVWPAALASHPDDPSAVGGAVARLVAEGADFRIGTNPAGTGAAFGLPHDPPGLDRDIPVREWATAVARIGVGIAPLADTAFNAAKSWLKPLEMAAAGVPFVASPRVEYSRLHALGAGLLADRPRTWYRELNRLRNDEGLRTELSAQGREAVRSLRIEQQAWRWLEAWADAVDIQQGHAVPSRAALA